MTDPSELLVEMRTWFAANKDTPECVLALKHRHAMRPEVAASIMSRHPASDAIPEERELFLVYSLAQVAEKLELVVELMNTLEVPPPPVTKPELVAGSHVDVEPFEPTRRTNRPPKT